MLPRLYIHIAFWDLFQGKGFFCCRCFFFSFSISFSLRPLYIFAIFVLKAWFGAMYFLWVQVFGIPYQPRNRYEDSAYLTLPLEVTDSFLLERSLGLYFAKVILYSHLDRIQKMSESTAKNANINIRYLSKCLISTRNYSDMFVDILLILMCIL